MAKNKRYTIVKKIAKHGKQAIIVIPRILEENLKPGTVAQITIDVIDENIDDKEFRFQGKDMRIKPFRSIK